MNEDRTVIHNMEQAVAGVLFFEGMEKEQIEILSRIAKLREYNKGNMVFHEGDEADGLYAVVSGKVKIFKSSFAGREQTLHIFGPGHPFGEVALFLGGRFPAHAQTLEKTTCLFLPKRDFLNLIKNNPDLVLKILAVLSKRLHMFTAQVESLSLKEVPERLAGYLLYLADQAGSDSVRLDIPKGELATLLGTIPETLSRIFTKLAQNNIIKVEGARIVILDRDTLESIATGETRI